MRMQRVLIQLPTEMKAQLDALKAQGFTISGFIRALVEKELSHPHMKKEV